MAENRATPGSPPSEPPAELAKAGQLFPELIEEARQKAKAPPAAQRTQADMTREPAAMFNVEVGRG